MRKIFYLLTLCYAPLSSTSLTAETVDVPGVYYHTNSSNQPDYANYIALDKNGTYQQNIPLSSVTSKHLRGRYEMSTNQDLIYLFPDSGEEEILRYLNGNLILNKYVFKKGDPARAKYLNSKSTINGGTVAQTQVPNLSDTEKKDIAARKKVNQLVTGPRNADPNADRDAQDIADYYNNKALKSMGIQPPIKEISQEWLKRDIEKSTTYSDGSEMDQKALVAEKLASLDKLLAFKVASGIFDNAEADSVRRETIESWGEVTIFKRDEDVIRYMKGKKFWSPDKKKVVSLTFNNHIQMNALQAFFDLSFKRINDTTGQIRCNDAYSMSEAQRTFHVDLQKGCITILPLTYCLE